MTLTTRLELDALIAEGLSEVSEAAVLLWRQIAIEPAKWQCPPSGDEGGGFWAVAIIDATVIWYNDIEEGFNRSTFCKHGTIDEYWCDQLEFAIVLNRLLTNEVYSSSGPPEPLRDS